MLVGAALAIPQQSPVHVAGKITEMIVDAFLYNLILLETDVTYTFTDFLVSTIGWYEDSRQ